MGERERKNERVNERVWSRLTLLGPSDVVQRALLSVGWQDELVNDCPLRQNADFIFPTSDVCAFSAAFRSSVPPKYCNFFTWYRPVFTTNVCLFILKHYFFICIMFLSASTTFPCMLTSAHSVIRGFGLRLEELWVTWGHTTLFHQ